MLNGIDLDRKMIMNDKDSERGIFLRPSSGETEENLVCLKTFSSTEKI
jgi:hypothetical protein